MIPSTDYSFLVFIGLRYFHWYRNHDFRLGGWSSQLGNIHFSQVDGIVVGNGRKVGKRTTEPEVGNHRSPSGKR